MDVLTWKEGKLCEILFLDKELQTTIDCWEKEN